MAKRCLDSRITKCFHSEMFAALLVDQSADYDIVKEAILKKL